MRAILTTSLLIFSICGAFGQAADAPAFEVASVKISAAGSGEGRGREIVTPSPAGVTMKNVHLKSVVQWAYHLILPWFTLSVIFIGVYSRVLRSTILLSALATPVSVPLRRCRPGLNWNRSPPIPRRERSVTLGRIALTRAAPEATFSCASGM